MRILNISKKEKEIINSGNLILLKEKIVEAENVWHNKLISTTKDHRYVQAVYTTILDMKELLT